MKEKGRMIEYRGEYIELYIVRLTEYSPTLVMGYEEYQAWRESNPGAVYSQHVATLKFEDGYWTMS